MTHLAEATTETFWDLLTAGISKYGVEFDDIDLIEWGVKYLPHYFTQDASKMHEWMADTLEQEFDQRGMKLCIVGPRGSAKSTVGNLVLILKRALEGKESFILVCSDTTRQAVEHLRAIKEELETNDLLLERYPHAVGMGPLWQTAHIQMNNGVVIRAVGTLSRIRGFRKKQYRPSLVVLDDPENDEHITSATMRKRTHTWFSRTLMHMGNADTNFLAMGTSIHRECLVLNLLQTPGWKTYRPDSKAEVFPSIMTWPTKMNLWERWERVYYDVDSAGSDIRARAFYDKRKTEMNLGAKVIWPDRESLYSLMELRAEIGHQAFESEKQGNPVDLESCEWPDEYFTRDNMWFSEWPTELAVRGIALDPSKGTNARRGDYSSFAYGGVDANGVFWVDFDIERRSTDKIVMDGVDLMLDFYPEIFAIEVNVFQELLAHEFQRAMVEADLLKTKIWPLDNRVKKALRIRRLSPLLAQNRFRFKNTRGSRLAMQQFKEFPNADHDDGPDSAEMLVRSINSLVESYNKPVDTYERMELSNG